MGPGAVAILLGARLVPRSTDTDYPFRQDSDFWYLTGFAHPDAIAILSTRSEPRFTLFVQPREPEAEVWTGYRPGLEGALSDFGADEAYDCASLPERLPDLLRGAERVYHSFGRRPQIDSQLVEIQEQLRRQSRRGVAPWSALLDPRSISHEMRLVKSEAELEIMRRAAAISCEAHAAAAGLAHADHYEYELEAALGHVFRRRGGSGPAYASIVAGGRNATSLHYAANERPLVAGALVRIDAGAELAFDPSDVTRPYPGGGRFEGAARDVYEHVLAAQHCAFEAVAPGESLPEIHSHTLRRLVEGMIDLGLLEGSPDGLIESEAYKPYYMHGTSHWLGLDVHDVGSYALAGEPRRLEPGMVFTLEPGLSIPADEPRPPAAL